MFGKLAMRSCKPLTTINHSGEFSQAVEFIRMIYHVFTPLKTFHNINGDFEDRSFTSTYWKEGMHFKSRFSKNIMEKKFVSFLKYRTSWHYCGEDYVEEKAKFLYQV